jgi:hypothetical protein
MYFKCHIYQIANFFLMIFSKIQVQFRIRIRIHNLELRIRILQKVADPDSQHW